MPETKRETVIEIGGPTASDRRARSSLSLLATLVMASALAAPLGAVGCGDDSDLPTNRGGRDGGTIVLGDAGEDADPMASCPLTQPRAGETCPGITEGRVTCTYKVGECVQPGATYDLTVDFCCNKGGNWDQCGANVTPCDNQPPPEAEDDAGVDSGVDGGVDAADAADDAPVAA